MCKKDIFERYLKKKSAKFIFTLESNLQKKLDYNEEIIEELHYFYFLNNCKFDMYYFINIARYLTKKDENCSHILEFILENYYEMPYILEYKDTFYVCNYEESFITKNVENKEKVKLIGGVLYKI
jgi:hypothetical protein